MAKLKINIDENISIEGQNYGSKRTLTIEGITEVFKRIVSCPANNETTIASFHGEVYSDESTLDKEDVKYIRVTNLDSSNSLTLSLQIDVGEDDTSADESASILLSAGESFMMGTPSDAVGVLDANASLVTDLVDLESLVIQPGSNTVKVEIFVASS